MKEKRYQFKRLEMYQGSAGELNVVCKITKQRLPWNKAAYIGWCADLNGEPFNAYYSPEAITEMAITDKERAEAENQPLIDDFARKQQQDRE